jgi:hypothetical protein
MHKHQMKIFVIVILCIAALFALQFDEGLSPEVNSWISILDERRSKHSEAFIYLSGIIATEEDDVLTIGMERYKAFTKVEDRYSIEVTSPDFEIYPESKHLPLPSKDDPIYCTLWEGGCLLKIVKADGRWQTELNTWREIYTRYLTFINYQEFITLSKPHISEDLPRYQYLNQGNRLRLFEAMLIASNGRPEEAISQLSGDISKLRVQLSEADNLIHKLVFTMLISYNLEGMVNIASIYGVHGTKRIPNLSAEELDLELPLIREFALIHYAFIEVDKHPEFFETGGDAPSWLVRAAFKPNMTINEAYYSYFNAVKLSRLPVNEFVVETAKDKPQEVRELDLLNLVGSVLANVAGLDYGVYIARLHDLNAKISLSNYVLSGRVGNLVNPYYPEDKVDTTEDERICMNGPYPDERNLRCIAIGIDNDHKTSRLMEILPSDQSPQMANKGRGKTKGMGLPERACEPQTKGCKVKASETQ